MKRFAAAVSGEILSGSTDYLNLDPSRYTCPLKSPRDCRNVTLLCEVYKFRAKRSSNYFPSKQGTFPIY